MMAVHAGPASISMHAANLRLAALRFQHEGLMLRLAVHKLEGDRLDRFLRAINLGVNALCTAEDEAARGNACDLKRMTRSLDEAAEALYRAKRTLDEVL